MLQFASVIQATWAAGCVRRLCRCVSWWLLCLQRMSHLIRSSFLGGHCHDEYVSSPGLVHAAVLPLHFLICQGISQCLHTKVTKTRPRGDANDLEDEAAWVSSVFLVFFPFLNPQHNRLTQIKVNVCSRIKALIPVCLCGCECPVLQWVTYKVCLCSWVRHFRHCR